MSIDQNREFMKCAPFAAEMAKSDQQNGVDAPPVNKASLGGDVIKLPSFEGIAINDSYTNLLNIRRSEREYNDQIPMTQAQLAYMLHTAMSIQEYRGVGNVATLRPAPSGGARHPFELYIAVKNVQGLTPGMYHYLPLEDVGKPAATIEYIGPIVDYDTTVSNMALGQKWAASAPCMLIFSCVPYRAEWRYRLLSHRIMLVDLGHVGQNVMLSAAALGLGSCCIGAYDQTICDRVLGFDGKNEFTAYCVSVGAPVVH